MLSALLVLPWPCGKAALGAPSKDRGGVASCLSSSWFWGAYMEPAPTLTSLASGSTLWRPLPTGNFLSSPGCIFLPHGLLIWVLCFTPTLPILTDSRIYLLQFHSVFFSSRICAGGSHRPLRSTSSPPTPPVLSPLLLTELGLSKHGCPDLVTPSPQHLKGSHHPCNEIHALRPGPVPQSHSSLPFPTQPAGTLGRFQNSPVVHPA